MGVHAPRQRWHFAEGYTGAGFDEYLTILNPNADAGAGDDHLLPRRRPGPGRQDSSPSPANARYTVAVHDAGAGRRARPGGRRPGSRRRWPAGIVVERPMYFRYGGSMGGVTGGHNVMGAAGPRPAWYFPEGNTGAGFDEYLTLLNPTADGRQVAAHLLRRRRGDAARRRRSSCRPTAAPPSPSTTPREGVGRGRRTATKVETTNGVGIVVERPMYFRYSATRQRRPRRDGRRRAGARPGSSPRATPATGFDEYLIVLNPNATPADVTITYYLGGGGAGRPGR